MNVARKRLTWKLLALLLLPVVVCVGGYGVVSASLRRAELLAEADRELTDHVATLRTTLPRIAPDELSDFIGTVARLQRVHGIALYDGTCRAIARSQDLEAASRDIDDLACQIARTGAERHGVERIGGVDTLLRAERLGDTEHVNVVVVTYKLAEVEAMIRAGHVHLAMAAGVLLAAMAAMAIVIARVLGRGLGDLVHSADRVAGGDLSTRIGPMRFLGLDRVAGAFNHMIEALAHARRQLDEEEARRWELERRMQHAQALSVVGQVAASLAHDVGSPLSTILGWARLSASDETLPASTREQAVQVAQQCERITRIVRRMLTLARPPEHAPGPVDMVSVAREVAAFLDPECRQRRIHIEVKVAPGLTPLVAERDRLLQLVMNLCMNAIQAQPTGGKLVIALEPSAASDRAGMVLEVRDAGPGVSAEQRPHLFELFYSTKRDQGGAGIGLPIVVGIARELEGTVDVQRAPEGGACFRVWFPSRVAEQQQDGAAA
jgi:signal transduction histidine kinase